MTDTGVTENTTTWKQFGSYPGDPYFEVVRVRLHKRRMEWLRGLSDTDWSGHGRTIGYIRTIPEVIDTILSFAELSTQKFGGMYGTTEGVSAGLNGKYQAWVAVSEGVLVLGEGTLKDCSDALDSYRRKHSEP